MNQILPNLPQWAWIAIAILGAIVAKRKGWLDQLLSPASPTPAVPPVNVSPGQIFTAPAPQVVEIRHVASSTAEASSTDPGLTEKRRVNFEFDVTVTPIAKREGGSP